jgi:hypothetical protein
MYMLPSFVIVDNTPPTVLQLEDNSVLPVIQINNIEASNHAVSKLEAWINISNAESLSMISAQSIRVLLKGKSLLETNYDDDALVVGWSSWAACTEFVLKNDQFQPCCNWQACELEIKRSANPSELVHRRLVHCDFQEPLETDELPHGSVTAKVTSANVFQANLLPFHLETTENLGRSG